MKWNVILGMKIQLEESDIEGVEKFLYFGDTVTTTGGAGKDISSRLGKNKQSSVTERTSGETVNSA